MNDAPQRPDPDLLLDRIESEEKEARHGKLKIFFGSSAGVGKTYAMLMAAREQLAQGVDVVVGIVETHQRAETEKLLVGLPMLEPLKVNYHGIVLRELDLEEAKKRKPTVLLVDELAHTNAPGLAHPKRWNDVIDLWDAGINVYTTLNVQHIESLSDLVAGTTGVVVKETVPDSVFDMADDIVLVDIDADDLLKRLHEGKVYVSQGAKARAAEGFFRKNNLIALRELALRRTAERVDAQREEYNAQEGLVQNQPVAEKIMVCINSAPLSIRLIHTAIRTATSLKAPWLAVYVEDKNHYKLSEKGRRALEILFRMIERNGGEIVVLQGEDVSKEIISYAKKQDVSRIILGKSTKKSWFYLFRKSPVDKIIQLSGNIDVHIVTDSETEKVVETHYKSGLLFKPALRFYFWTTGVLTVLTTFGILARDVFNPTDQALFYLAGVVPLAIQYGLAPSLLYSVLAIFCWSFFFIPPFYTVNPYNTSHLVSFIAMFAASCVVGHQASQIRLQTLFARRRERQTQTLYRLTREMTRVRGRQSNAQLVARHVAELLDVGVTIWTPNNDGLLIPVVGDIPHNDALKEQGALQWCFDNAQIAGRDTDTMPSAVGLYVPLLSSTTPLGILGLIPRSEDRHFSTDEINSAETLASLLSSALERVREAEISQESRVEAEAERLRNTLLSSVSHDLSAPLKDIQETSERIAVGGDKLSPEEVRLNARSIHQETEHLLRIVHNILDITSLETGAVCLNKQMFFVEEVIGAAIIRTSSLLEQHIVTSDIAKNLPMVMMDGALIERTLINLLENASQYTPQGSTIHISVEKNDRDLIVSVSDNGPGIPTKDEQKIFEKFYTSEKGGSRRGSGLGLAICDSIIKAHKGRIWAENLSSGGARFRFTIPLSEEGEK